MALCLLQASIPASATSPPKSAVQQNNIGVALMNQQLTAKALTKFETASAANPALVAPLVNQGIALLYLQKVAQSQALLDRAIEMDPKNAGAWYTKGLLERTSGDSQKALADFQQVLRLDANDADTHYFVGISYLDLLDLPRAISEFQKALELNPSHASAQFGLARALQRQGKAEAAKERLKRFEELTARKISFPISSVYGEQGMYARAQQILTAESPVQSMIPMHFEPVQVTLRPSATVASSNLDLPPASNAVGGGACVLDLFGSGRQDVITVSGSSPNAVRLFRNEGNAALTEVDAAGAGLRAAGQGVSCAVGDFDNDGLPDVAIALQDRVLLFRNLGGKFTDVTAKSGLTAKNSPAGLTFVDFDHDGDLDLLITGTRLAGGGNPNVLWRNNGDSTFTEWTEAAGFAGPGDTSEAVLSDLNNDRAVDLLITNSNSAPLIYSNHREGAFSERPLYSEMSLGAGRGAAIFDADKDGWMDVAVTHAGMPGISLWRNNAGKGFSRIPLPSTSASSGRGVTAIDFDNDGWIDLAALLDTPRGIELHLWRNLGPAGFADVSRNLDADKITLTDPVSLIAVDLDHDGAADLLISQRDGSVRVLHNIGGSANHSLRITLKGLADNRTALGTKVEVFADGVWQKFEVAGGSGYLGQGPAEVLAGLGAATHAEIVRILWPTGVPQDEIDLADVRTISLEEIDRRGSSCPVVFSWDGSQYRFVSDIIGAAVVGHWVSPHKTNRQDADEWLKIDGDSLKPRNGLLSVRVGEPMEEINYIDQVRLVAVDHPSSIQTYPEERFLSEPPFASGAAIATSAARPVSGAWDNGGNDVTELLRAQDHRYVTDFANLPFAGFAKPHTLTLDLGAWSPTRPLRLLFHGYVEYFSASSMYSAWQSGLSPMPPMVEEQLSDGSWHRIVDDMGFPAGLARTIVVDLTGRLDPAVTRIRLTTNLQIYWDEVLVDNGENRSSELRQTELPLRTAHLAFRGYPQQVSGATPGDLTYRYDRISSTGPFLWVAEVIRDLAK